MIKNDTQSNLSIIQSRNIYDYKPVLEGLVDDFGFIYFNTMLKWCKVISDSKGSDRYWEVYLIKQNQETIGVCGLYNSQYKNSTEELWLGWFGIIPNKRNEGIGEYALNWMKQQAKSVGCKKLMSYVDKNGKPLQFYYRNDFKLVGTVKEYLSAHTELSMESFEDENDYVIEYLIP